MTVRINLLPRSYQPPRPLGARYIAAAVAGALAVVVGAIYYTNIYQATVDLERQTASQQARLGQVRTMLAEASEIGAREGRVAKAEVELKSLGGYRWSTILLTLRDLTPQHVTWTGLQVDGQAITLTGTSRGLFDVAQLFGGLINDSQVAEVALHYVNEQGVPVTIALKAGEELANLPPSHVEHGGGPVFRQLEFEMVITLYPPEGRQPYGA